jgi:3-oxoacyl-[acyl-carrier protein] reductase
MKDTIPRLALVTGSTGLIGRDICRTLVRSGATVCGAYFKGHEMASSLEQELNHEGRRFVPFAADLSNPLRGPLELYQGVVASLGEPDILVACAALKLRRLAIATKSAEAAEVMALNFESTIELARLATRPMMRKRWGRIVLLGSFAGTAGCPGQAVYAASKAALSVWATSLAGELGGSGVTINVIAPGALKDDQNSNYNAMEADKVIQLIGCRRLGEPHEIAGVVEFLCSNQSSYVNGATIPVDGAARF